MELVLERSRSLGLDPQSETFAAALDASDELAAFRDEFMLPESGGTYLCGNSLGLQPKSMKQVILSDLERWAKLGVDGHFADEGPSVPWLTIEEETRDVAAAVVGALRDEVICMNSLTVNLHLLLACFYRPKPTRYKIVIEADAFPSDDYAVQSWAANRGYGSDAIVRVSGSTNEIIEAIQAPDVALALVSALQYYTGELFDVRRIANAGRDAGVLVGFDLAHAVGNVPLALHDDGVDFACWCSYKYLNAGPGAIAGAFIHQTHAQDLGPGALRGWWGNRRESRFEMRSCFDPMPGVAGLQLSNPPTLPMLQLREALRLHTRAGAAKLREKSVLLTGYLELLLRRTLGDKFSMLTPVQPHRRGAQLSLLFEPPLFDVDEIYAKLRSLGVVIDVRRPNVVRVAPAPLYNSFADVQRFASLLRIICRDHGALAT